jgi:Ca2+-binding EF-hand superfamily protein
MDTDNSGTLSLLEFRNAMRKLNIGLSAKDLDCLLARIDTNNDGKIDWQEFQKQFKTSDTEKQIKSSCQNRLNSMRMHMCSFMLSPRDAFNQFDIERSGKLSFNAFTSLVQRLSELSREPVPAFPVIKDLFDIIDIRKDGVLDMREWLNTFKDAEKNTWEDSRQYEDVCKVIAKNRKMLIDMFEQVGRGGRCEYEKAKEAMGTVLQDFPLGEENWRKILGVAFKDNMVDYKTMLDIYKQRCTSAQLHPR